jgi:hypothetical protein
MEESLNREREKTEKALTEMRKARVERDIAVNEVIRCLSLFLFICQSFLIAFKQNSFSVILQRNEEREWREKFQTQFDVISSERTVILRDKRSLFLSLFYILSFSLSSLSSSLSLSLAGTFSSSLFLLPFLNMLL